MRTVKIFLKGWNDSELYSNAVNDPSHELHTEAMAAHLRAFQPYEPGDVMREAFTYTDDAPQADDMVVCERVFRWFNIGDNPVSRQYRAKGNRSLSVGDVVVVDNVAYTVDRFGWTALDSFEPNLAPR